MEPNNVQPPEKPTKGGYGRRPLWQWVVIYLVLAVIVYGVVYYFFFYHNGGTTGNTGLGY